MIEKTGHDLAYWFGVLDRFGGLEPGHTASAAHLCQQHEVPAWYSQSIVVAYERARGKRVLHQRGDGAFDVSVSKVIGASTPVLVTALADTARRQEWGRGVDGGLIAALEAGLQSPPSKGFITRPDGQARCRFTWDGTTVQLNLYPKGPAKTSVVAQPMDLRSADEVDRRRGAWKTAFAALAAAVTTRTRCHRPAPAGAGWMNDETHIIGGTPIPELGITVLAHQRQAGVTRAVAGLMQTSLNIGRLVALALIAVTAISFVQVVLRYENTLASVNDGLERLVERRTCALTRTQSAVIFGLARLADSRDEETGLHLQRIQARRCALHASRRARHRGGA